MSEPRTRKRRAPYKLSERQRRMLQYIEQCYRQTGYPPTIREIGEAVNIASTSVVNYNLNKLEEAGYIRREKKVSRGLRMLKNVKDETLHQEMPVRLTDLSQNFMPVPLVGQIVASAPVPLPEEGFGEFIDEDDVIELPMRLLGKAATKGEVFALRVSGDSMIDALVNHDDIIVLKRQDTANNGDMVAVWLSDNNETTLKYFYREGSQIRLQPANTNMEPIYVEARQVRIQGRVLAVLRQV